MRSTARLVLVAALAVIVSCAHAPSSVVTPQGKAAFAADQVLTRVEEVMNATIAAATPNAAGVVAVKKPVADIIVGFCRDAAVSIKQVPNGWLPVVRTAWAAAKQRIPPADLASVQGYIIAVDTLLAGAGGLEALNGGRNPRLEERTERVAHPGGRHADPHSRSARVYPLAA